MSPHLWCQHKRLHEPPHGTAVIGQLPHHLDDDPITEGRMSINMTDLGVTLTELQRHHLLMDLLQKDSEEGIFRQLVFIVTHSFCWYTASRVIPTSCLDYPVSCFVGWKPGKNIMALTAEYQITRIH